MAKVLIIDDCEDNLFLLSQDLDDEGYEVVTANNGPDGIQAAQQHLPDVILTDIMMPVMDGIEVCKKLKSDPVFLDTPIIMLTAKYHDDDIVQGLEAGAWDYIIKPYNYSVLSARLKNAVSYSNDQKKLAAAKQQAEEVLQILADGIVTIDAQGKIIEANKSAETMLGFQESDLINQPINNVFNLVHESSKEDLFAQIYNHGAVHSLIHFGHEAYLINQEGKEWAIEGFIAPLNKDNEKHSHLIICWHNVTEQRALTKKLIYRSLHDPLTNTLNRDGLTIKINEAINQSRLTKTCHSLCYIDLDDFKLVNDTYGHAKGDDYLKQLTTVLEQQTRDGDSISRLGGDEFVIILWRCPLPGAKVVGNNIIQSLQNISKKLFPELSLGVSIGISKIDSETVSCDDVLNDADQALYQAKHQGKNRLCVYTQVT